MNRFFRELETSRIVRHTSIRIALRGEDHYGKFDMGRRIAYFAQALLYGTFPGSRRFIFGPLQEHRITKGTQEFERNLRLRQDLLTARPVGRREIV